MDQLSLSVATKTGKDGGVSLGRLPTLVPPFLNLPSLGLGLLICLFA